MGAHSFIPFEEPERQARPENPQPMPYTSGALRRAHLWVSIRSVRKHGPSETVQAGTGGQADLEDHGT